MNRKAVSGILRGWRIGAAICIAVLSAAGAWANEKPTYEKEIDQGLFALESGHAGEAMAAFRRALELRPEDASAAYNLACAYARQEKVEEGFDWLALAAVWGYNDVEHARKDGDLEHLRSDPRYAILIDQIQKGAHAVGAPVYISDTDPALGLVVMVEGLTNDVPTIGAGIVVGQSEGRLYIATANHVVRRARE
jgi:tetratricopeptide (TPR) repeat protein